MKPRYAQPTKSTKLYSYTNRDQDIIKQSFRAGNYTFLAKIPKKITPFGVTAAIRDHSKKNLISKPRSVSVKKSSHNYEWMPDSYNLKRDFMKRVREDNVRKRKTISARDFICSGTPNKKRERELTPRSFVSVNTSFNSARDHASRLKWIKDMQIKHGDFRVGKSLETYQSKSTAQEIIIALKKKISSDWELTDFDIGLNNTSCIELRFYMKTVESSEAMHHYMNLLINKNQEMGKFCLKRVPSNWGVKNGKFLVYIMAPAWVKVPGNSLNRTLELKKATLSPIRSKAGSVKITPRFSTRESSISHVRNYY
ncbi:hypothetical protein SteCoe_1444 [Stentor coeruleus]|uniref:Uncharacterized protein n=1 Tax=Stentor coeruleus TaxID=5963 RepID=A0A1R2D1V8_9CILI|nr:hypothetical protein SteCoe_1444 [Stentor coeruleus]